MRGDEGQVSNEGNNFAPPCSPHPDILALKHISRIFGHCNNPALPFCMVCGCDISSCSVLKYWLQNEKQEVLGCCNVRKFNGHALARMSVHILLLRATDRPMIDTSFFPFFAFVLVLVHPERKMRAGRAERGLPGGQDCCLSPHREQGGGERERVANAFGREKRLAALSTVAGFIG